MAKHLVTVVISAMFIVPTTLLHAQQTDQGRVVEEVVTTAQKREQSVQDVPVSVTSMPEDFIRETGADRIDQMIMYTPGITGATAGAATSIWAIRGISTNDFTTGAEPSVATLQNDAYIARNVYATGAFFDVQRVEVLRGPQGTLFGRNAVAGAINIINNEPADSHSLEFGYAAGNEGQRIADLVGNVVLSDRVAARFAYHASDYEGVQGVVGAGGDMFLKDDAARISLRADATDEFTLHVMAQWYEAKSNANRFHYPELSSAGFGENYPAETAQDSVGSESNETLGFNLRAAWDINDSLVLTFISDHRDFDFAFRQDLDADADLGFGGPVDFDQPRVDGDTLSQELRLSGQQEAYDWYIGGIHFRENTHEQQQLLIGLFPVDAAVTNGQTNSLAVYGELAWHLSDATDLVVGGRYTDDEKDWCAINADLTGLAIFGPDTGGAQLCDTARWSQFTPRVVLNHKATDSVMLYASYNEGFKSGGFNSAVEGMLDAGSGFLVPTGRVLPYAPEELKAYEVGFKAQLVNGSLRLNAAAYFNDYSDLQVQILGLQILTSNAAEAQIRGLELEALWLPPVAGLTLSASYAYNDTEFVQGVIQGMPVTGNQLNLAPENSLSATAQQEWSVASGTVRWFVACNWQDSQFFDVFNSAYRKQDSYALVNTRLTYESGAGRWNVYLAGDNVFDEEYASFIGDPLGLGTAGITRGRSAFWRAGFNVFLGD